MRVPFKWYKIQLSFLPPSLTISSHSLSLSNLSIYYYIENGFSFWSKLYRRILFFAIHNLPLVLLLYLHLLHLFSLSLYLAAEAVVQLRPLPLLSLLSLVGVVPKPLWLVRRPPTSLTFCYDPPPRPLEPRHRESGQRGAHPQLQLPKLPKGAAILLTPRRPPRPRHLQRGWRHVALPA